MKSFSIYVHVIICISYKMQLFIVINYKSSKIDIAYVNLSQSKLNKGSNSAVIHVTLIECK